MKLVYVAGPISCEHTPDMYPVSFLHAIATGSNLVEAGFAPVLPHINCFFGLHVEQTDLKKPAITMTATPKGNPKIPYNTYMEVSFALLAKCDILLRLPGQSPGADQEVDFAKEKGIRVYYTIQHLILGEQEALHGF